MTNGIGQRGQCLLCQYGLSLRPAANARAYATYFISNVRGRRPHKSTHREEKEERAIERQLLRGEGRERIKGRTTAWSLALGPRFFPTSKLVKLSQNEQDDGHVDVLLRLEKCFDLVWQKDGVDGTTLSQLLNDLDPTGERWKKYVDDVRQLFGMPDSQVNAKDKQLYADLLESLTSEGFWGNTARLLRFSFIDKALEAQGFNFHDIIEYVPDMQNPTEWYPTTRQLQRHIHLHVGPTNSGKTYTALKQLEAARAGFYAGPLRLLAHEVYSRFLAKGIPCDLVTGDDVRLHEDEETRRTSSTVEMVSCVSTCDVAVIDEIQMIADESRGWAWTRALLGSRVRELHLCGEERVVPLIQELAATMGDNLQIHRYERLNPLKVMSRSLRGDLKNLRKGDCVVSFSVMNIHAMKKQIEKETGRHAAIVYGSLPPEVRAQQAALFNDPDNDYDFLVASDAIGMGLNLSIKRIIFESLDRFNGFDHQKISISQIKQIAGRAGRYRTARDDAVATPSLDTQDQGQNARDQRTVGLVTCLDENDLSTIQDALNTVVAPIKMAGLLPPGQYIEEFANRLPLGLPFEYLLDRICKAASVNPRYKICDIRSQLKIARVIESVTGLSISERYAFCASPADSRSKDGERALQGLARCIAERKEVTIADVPEIPLEILDAEPTFDRIYLTRLEVLHKSVILYLWLGYRFSNIFKEMAMAFHAKALAEERINICLTNFSANPKLRERLKKMRSSHKLPLGPLQESSESQDKESQDSAINEGESFVDESHEKGPMEDESSELDLAVKELELAAREAEFGIGEIGEINKYQGELDTGPPPRHELQTDNTISSKTADTDNLPVQGTGSENKSPATSKVEGKGPGIEINPDTAVIRQSESDLTPDPGPDTGAETSTMPETSIEGIATGEQNGSQDNWATRNLARPVVIPTEDQSHHDEEAAKGER